MRVRRLVASDLSPFFHPAMMRPCIEQSNDLAPLSPSRCWLDCTTNTSGYDFRKGQAVNGVLIATLYAPNGNPQPGPKFKYKLAWMKGLLAHLDRELPRAQPPEPLYRRLTGAEQGRDLANSISVVA